jgi:TRAP-type C4-dicarboxylate transport system permease small subunit
MSSHSVLEDDSTVSRVDRALYAVESKLTLLAGIIALGVMLLAVANIVGRKVGDIANDRGWAWLDANFGPVPGYIDWTEQAVPAIAILGLVATQRDGGHIRMDIAVGALKGRALWLFELLSVIFMLIITSALIYGTWDHAARAIRNGDSTVDINLPIWPAKVLFPIIFILLFVRLIVQIWAYARAFKSGAEQPAAIPIPEDAATQALNEALTVSGFDKAEAEARK